MWNSSSQKKKHNNNNNNNNNKKALVLQDTAVICLLDNVHLCYFGKRKPFLFPFFLFYFSPTPMTLLNYVHQLLFHDEETNKQNKPRGFLHTALL